MKGINSSLDKETNKEKFKWKAWMNKQIKKSLNEKYEWISE